MDHQLQEIIHKHALISAGLPPQKNLLTNLDDWFRVELTYTSNAIEGNTLTRIETASIIEKGQTVEGKTIREHQEALNHSTAFTFIQNLAKQKPLSDFTLNDLLDIHRLILKNIDDQSAGRLRSIPVRIAGSTTILPNPLKVPDLMAEFITWLNSTTDHPVQVAIDAHYKLVTIHPFIDGNGRTARLLMNMILIQAGFPPAIIKKEERNRYLSVLESAQTIGNMNAYYELMYDSINRSLDVYLQATTPPTDSPTFYTTHEVAMLLKLDPESIRRYIRTKKLPAVKIGKFIRIEKTDLDKFTKDHK